jgi:hypothetical protein
MVRQQYGRELEATAVFATKIAFLEKTMVAYCQNRLKPAKISRCALFLQVWGAGQKKQAHSFWTVFGFGIQ